jgi:uncharacterized protein
LILIVPTEFTPLAAAAGGALIGLSAVVLMAGNGRIAGCSSVFRHLLSVNFDTEFIWRAVFIIGLLAGTFFASPFATNAQHLAYPPMTITIVGGLLVGFGTALSRGCTSGHGICGIARFSRRSIIATVTFMAVAIVTVYVMRHVMGA